MHPPVELSPIAEDQLDDFVDRLRRTFAQATHAASPEFLGYVPNRRYIDEVLDDPSAETLSIIHEGHVIGGAVITGGDVHKTLEFIFIDPDKQNLRLGQAAWQAIEERYPTTKMWELVSAYHEKRNIHFYVNKCGFHIVEYFNKFHNDPDLSQEETGRHPGKDGGLFKFVKVLD